MAVSIESEDGMADRNTDGFFNRVYDMVRQVPCGMVATYGQIAKLVGEPRRADMWDTPCTSIRNPGTYLVTASYSRTDASRMVSPSAGPRCNVHCSKMKALPSSPTDMSTCRPLAGPPGLV